MNNETDASTAATALGPIPGGLAERNQEGYAITVRTKEELERAQKDLAREIIVLGKLADDLQTASKIATLSKVALTALTASIDAGVALAPATMGTSGVVAAGVVATAAATAGVSTATIICACAIGLSLVIAVCKDYKKVDCKAGFMHLKLEK